MELDEAVAIVVSDQRQSDPDITREDALAHVRNTLSIDTLNGEPGEDLYTAYVLVLSEEKLSEPGADTPESIRGLRERLGLSRRDVEIGTSLSSSVVWRAEQVGRNVTDEERVKIWDFLIGFEGEHPGGKQHNVAPKGKKSPRTPKPTAESGEELVAKRHLDHADKMREEWMTKTWELRGVIDEAHDKLVAMLDEAKAKKRSTAGMKELIDLLQAHTTEH